MRINKIKSALLKITNNIEIIIVALMIFIAPLVVNYNDLPKGYEIPKVTFLQISTIILIAIFLFKELYKAILVKTFKFDKSLFVLLMCILLIVITSILSPFQQIAWIGNPFRFQGAFTHILMVLFTYIIYKSGNRKNLILIFVVFFLSSLVQSISALGQLRFFIENNPKAIFEGYYINGTFGQANFYSGRIMLGILSGIFLISFGSEIMHRKKVNLWLMNLVNYLIIPLIILILIVGLIISFSTWGIITSGIAVFTLIVYEIVTLFTKRHHKGVFGYLFTLISTVGLIAGGLILIKLYTQQIENIRLLIWERIIYITSHDSFARVLLGYGYDTLGEVFRKFGEFRNLYIDRAHNFFLDIYSQNGLLALLGIIYLIGISFFKFIFKRSSRLLTYIFLALFFWLFRSLVHESGIVNLYDFCILLGATLALQKDINFNFKRFNSIFLGGNKRHSDSNPDLLLQIPDSPTPNL